MTAWIHVFVRVFIYLKDQKKHKINLNYFKNAIKWTEAAFFQ